MGECPKGVCFTPEGDEVGLLGLPLVVTAAPEGMIGFPFASMGMVVVPAVLLVTTITEPVEFWKVAWTPLPVKRAAVGCPLLPLTNCTAGKVVPAA